MRLRNALIVILCFCCFGPFGRGQDQQASNESGRKVLRRVDPTYPQLAKKMNLGGTVKLVCQVSQDGKVTKVEALGGSPLLVQAAENAISQWKYAPGPESKETVELHFIP